MNNKLNNQKGFTLIEMLVVIAIVGLLSSVVVVGLSGAREQARDARRVAEVREIQNALELAYQSTSGYPSSIPSGAPTTDPQGNSYSYEQTDSGWSYALGVGLEGNENDNYDASICPGAVTSAPAFCVTPN